VAFNRFFRAVGPTKRVMQSTVADGSAAADAHRRVEIDRDDDLDRMRYRCPNGHTRWTPTNNHIYCHSCASFADPGEGPEYWRLRDAKTETEIPWSAVEFV
jgi:hypothetical protein